MEDSMLFYRSFWDAVNKIDEDKTKVETYNAIFSYALDGIIPDNLSRVADISFTLIKPQIDANIKRRRDGRNGGRPPKETGGLGNKNQRFNNLDTDIDKSFNSMKPNDNVNDNKNENDNINQNEKGECKFKTYGTYKNVLLNKEEYELIKAQFPDTYTYGINRYSAHKEESGKTYNSDSAMVIRFLKEDDEKYKQQKLEDEETERLRKQRELLKNDYMEISGEDLPFR